MSRARTNKRVQQDGDVSTGNILPKGTGRGGRTPNKRAKSTVEEEEKLNETSEVMDLLGRIDHEFQEEEEKKEEEEGKAEEIYDPPANQEQEEKEDSAESPNLKS